MMIKHLAVVWDWVLAGWVIASFLVALTYLMSMLVERCLDLIAKRFDLDL